MCPWHTPHCKWAGYVRALSGLLQCSLIAIFCPKVGPPPPPPQKVECFQIIFYWNSERHSELSPPRKECKWCITRESRRPGGHCDSIQWYQALTPEPPGPTATNSHNLHHIPIPTWELLAQCDFHIDCMLNLMIMCQRGDAQYCKLYDKLLGSYRWPATPLAWWLPEIMT